MLHRRLLLATGGALIAAPHIAISSQPDEYEVDLALALLVDVSASVSVQRFELQKQGYAAAFESDAVIDRITAGEKRTISVSLIQWSGAFQQLMCVPWMNINNRLSAKLFAQQVRHMRPQFKGATAIGSALVFGAEQFSFAPTAKHKVIDISGDGPHTPEYKKYNVNVAISPIYGRNYALARGIIINGLPIMLQAPIDGSQEFVDDNNEEMIKDYSTHVIGGPDSFFLIVRNPDDEVEFARAIRRKLLREAGM